MEVFKKKKNKQKKRNERTEPQHISHFRPMPTVFRNWHVCVSLFLQEAKAYEEVEMPE